MQIQKYEIPAHAVQHVHLMMLVGAITALAVACLSVWLLDTTPAIDWDEGWTATIAENWVERGFYGRLSNNELAPPGLSASFPVVGTVALAMRVFGVGIWQGRLAAVITMTAALALYFLLLRSWFDWRVALTTMCILVLLVPHPRANVFWMARQMFAEPLQFLTLLGGFAALLLTRTKSRLWLVAVILFWATALASKAQVLPFFAVMGAALVGLNVLNRRYRDARFALIAVVGALVGWQLELRTFDWILSGHSMPAEPLPDISLVLGFVPSPSIRITAFVVAWLVGTPVILGLAYFLFQRIRHNHWLRLLDRDEDLRISLWVLATTWFLWYVFMSHAGITRYIFSPIFFGAPFAAVMFRDFTDNFNVRSTMWRLVAPLRTKRLSRKNVGAWIVFSLILFYLPLTLFISYQTATATEGRDLIMTTDYLNQNTPTDARIETYESPLFIYLHRSYHYPPDALHLELNKRAARLPAVVNYDALQSDPDYLVVGPTARTWQLYDPVIAAGVFRLIQSFGQYTIYQRVRP
jgi:hypothetical protein